jgi:hypothetical protein
MNQKQRDFVKNEILRAAAKVIYSLRDNRDRTPKFSPKEIEEQKELFREKLRQTVGLKLSRPKIEVSQWSDCMRLRFNLEHKVEATPKTNKSVSLIEKVEEARDLAVRQAMLGDSKEALGILEQFDKTLKGLLK